MHLVSQRVQATVNPSGLEATITWEDEYENQTYQAQEVIYEFSLPNDAVVTNLSLGPNLEYPGVLAPRGAAQKTYDRERNRSRDPALLEQTGPRQYRLRVFPIPAKNDTSTTNGKHQKVSFSYTTLKQPKGFALPRFSKRSNIFTDSNSQRVYLVSGFPTKQLEEDTPYLTDPSRLDNSICWSMPLHSWHIDNATFSAQIEAIPEDEAGSLSYCATDSKLGLAPGLDNTRIALLFDVSASNKTHPFAQEVRELLRNNSDILSRNHFDWYRFNDKLSQPQSVTSDFLKNAIEVTNFGTSDVVSAISSLPDHYDAIIIATGEIPTTDEKNLPVRFRQTPLYFLHVDGKIPPYPTAWTHTIVRSEGGVADTLADALTHISLMRKQTNSNITNQKSYILPSSGWKINLTYSEGSFPSLEDAYFTVSGSGFPQTYQVSKRYFFSEWGEIPRYDEMNLAVRDAFHKFAKQNYLITPYTSYIALVNAQQYQNLQQEAQNYDRYEETKVSTDRWESAPLAIPGAAILAPSFMGMDGSNLSLPSPDGMGGGAAISNVPIVKTASLGRGAGSFIWLFVIGNILLLAAGGFIYGLILLRRLIRKKPKNV